MLICFYSSWCLLSEELFRKILLTLILFIFRQSHTVCTYNNNSYWRRLTHDHQAADQWFTHSCYKNCNSVFTNAKMMRLNPSKTKFLMRRELPNQQIRKQANKQDGIKDRRKLMSECACVRRDIIRSSSSTTLFRHGQSSLCVLDDWDRSASCKCARRNSHAEPGNTCPLIGTFLFLLPWSDICQFLSQT